MSNIHKIPASKLQWPLEHFSKEEFPVGVLKKTSSNLITRLAEFRKALGSSLIPTPVPEGIVRTDERSSGSQHYAIDRLSTAIDVFLPDTTDARVAFILACQFFTGVGIYYDTSLKGKPRVMLHLDMRESPLVWCRHKGDYHYPVNGKLSADNFFYLLNKGTPQP